MKISCAVAISLSVGLMVASPTSEVFARGDVAGSQDPPVIGGRYPGSTIIGYKYSDFDEKRLVIGPAEKENEPSAAEYLEGRRHIVVYQLPAGRSLFEVIRNYETILGQRGFEPLFTCKEKSCGDSRNVYQQAHKSVWFMYQVMPRKILNYQITTHEANHQRYWAGRLLERDGISVYVMLYAWLQSTHNNLPLLVLDVVETTPMQLGLEVVTADVMADQLSEAGRVSVYGIHFDFDSDTLKPESDQTLAQIAALLENDPELQLEVEGHTDNVGEDSYNLDLSTRRAASVVRALVERFGIARERLLSVGRGEGAPVSPNDTDLGRAENRRVELVRRAIEESSEAIKAMQSQPGSAEQMGQDLPSNEMMSPPLPSADPTAAIEERLAKLKALFDKGLISDSEYQSKKAEILSEL